MGEVDADRGEDAVVFAVDVGVEEQFGGGRAGQPAVLGDLVLELASTPSRIAQRHQRMAWAASRGYGAQDVDRRGQADVVRYGQRGFHRIVVGMEHETAAAVDRPAV